MTDPELTTAAASLRRAKPDGLLKRGLGRACIATVRDQLIRQFEHDRAYVLPSWALSCLPSGVAARRGSVAAISLLFASGIAHAQSVPSIWVEATTDDRHRGLSWSNGKAALRVGASAMLGPSVEIGAIASTARNSSRHNGADAVIDLDAHYRVDLGAVRVTAGVTGHTFPGAARSSSYIEADAAAGLLYGPVQLDLSARYAPDQSAIGGDNLYLALDGRAGVMTTPFTVRAGVGHTTGQADNPVRSRRLRPDGAYWDWLLGIDYVAGPITLGVDYIGTDISRGGARSLSTDFRHAGDTVVGRVSIDF